MRIFSVIFFMLLALFSSHGSSPRYIFYFIGDGMGFEHLRLAGGGGVSFSSFPVSGSVATASLDSDITDSAASGTALATGQRTCNGVVSMDSLGVASLPSVMDDAVAAGYGIAVLTSVSLDHATPAAFYAHSPSRNSYRAISAQLPDSGIDLFAGAGFRDADSLVFSLFAESGYGIFRGPMANISGSRAVWIQPEGMDSRQLPYRTERRYGDMSLPGMVLGAMIFFEDRGVESFLMVVEGGMIDWASHANNTENAVGEVEDFSQAVSRAMVFYQQHPDDCLILVTADHETGGLHYDSFGRPQWSTTGHTGADVPLFAIGVGAENFAGRLTNAEVALRLRSLINTKK